MRVGILFSLVAFAFCLGVEAGFLDRLEKIHDGFHALRDVVHNTFQKFAHDPNSTITAKLFPEAAELLHKRALKLEQCYESTIGGKKLNVFKMPLGEFVHKFIEITTRGEKHSKEEIHQRIKNLVATVHRLAKSIIDCVRNDDPKHEPTRLGFNQFATMSLEHQQAVYLNPIPKMGRKNGEQIDNLVGYLGDEEEFPKDKYENANPPETYDYRDQGVVSPIKNQGCCGSCFAFGTMAAMESAYMLKYNKRNISFNVKLAFDCMIQDGEYVDKTCTSGSQAEAMFQMAKKHGLVLDNSIDQYALQKADGSIERTSLYDFHPERCTDKANNVAIARLKTYLLKKAVPDELTLKKIIYTFGPVSTMFRATDNFMRLSNSRWNLPCTQEKPTSPDHVMTIVGWDRTHWILKNSYGEKPMPIYPTFGIAGYVYANKRHAESCGIIGPDSKIILPVME